MHVMCVYRSAKMKPICLYNQCALIEARCERENTRKEAGVSSHCEALSFPMKSKVALPWTLPPGLCALGLRCDFPGQDMWVRSPLHHTCPRCTAPWWHRHWCALVVEAVLLVATELTPAGSLCSLPGRWSRWRAAWLWYPSLPVAIGLDFTFFHFCT